MRPHVDTLAKLLCQSVEPRTPHGGELFQDSFKLLDPLFPSLKFLDLLRFVLLCSLVRSGEFRIDSIH